MNSIQLISKINARIEDLAMLSQEVLKPNNELSNIEKEVLKRTCSDLFELILKLKTSNYLNEEHLALKENISQEMRKEELSFKEIIANKVINEEFTINTLAETKLGNENSILEEVLVGNATIQEELKIEDSKQVINEVQISEIPQMPLFTFTHTDEVVEKEELAETVIENQVIVNVKDEFIAEPIVIIEHKINQIVAVTQPEIIFEQDINAPTEVILPMEEMPIQEIKPLIVEQKPVEVKPILGENITKPNSFFSIGKTVMPSSEPSLNERIAQKIGSFQFSDKIIEPKIDSLKTAISLNKKIAFVNELFKENVVEYAKSIDKINNAGNLNEAMLFWSELKIAHNWNNENPLVKDLEKLIQRRFS